MSLWWYGRKRRGKRSLWQIDTDPVAVLQVIMFSGVVAALNLLAHPSLAAFLIFVFLGGGLACLCVAKMSLFRQGIWLSFGSGLMSAGYARLYKLAYVYVRNVSLIENRFTHDFDPSVDERSKRRHMTLIQQF